MRNCYLRGKIGQPKFLEVGCCWGAEIGCGNAPFCTHLQGQIAILSRFLRLSLVSNTSIP
jgi:hypothetical protein